MGLESNSINATQRIIKEAENHIWTIGDKSMDSIAPLMAERYKAGVKQFRFMIAESQVTPNMPSKGRVGIEERTLPQIPAMGICTEKEAAVCLLASNGRADYSGFFGANAMTKKWVSDLFSYFWSTGKRVIDQ